MVSKRVGNGGWDRAVPAMSEDGLLLAEVSHRVSNEVAAALAAMRLVQSGRAGHGGEAMVDAAVGRLEGFAAVLNSLRVPDGGAFDLHRGLVDLCESLVSWRNRVGHSALTLDVVETVVDGATARRLMMIAAELVQNSVRHALEHRRGSLDVVLRRDAHEIRLAVIDNGPGIRADAGSRGTGMGRHIVAELVRRGGGELSYESGPRGTTVRVAMPREQVARIG